MVADACSIYFIRRDPLDPLEDTESEDEPDAAYEMRNAFSRDPLDPLEDTERRASRA